MGKETVLLHEEAAAFAHYLEREMDGAKDIRMATSRILFSRQADQYEYWLQGDRIIRTKNGLGYVTVCFNVKNMVIYRGSHGLELKLKLERNYVSVEMNMILGSTVDTS